MSQKLKECRNCKNDDFSNLFSLGKLAFSGKFSKNKKENIPKDFINLIICKNCKLVQLDRNFNPKYLYGKDYGYRSGINKTMTVHLQNTAKKLQKLTHLKSGDCVVDIASNDGTLLKGYKKYVVAVGIDPIINKYKKMSELSVNHLLGIKYITKNDIDLIFETADHFKEVINRPIKKVPSLRDITIANIFFYCHNFKIFYVKYFF